MSPPPVTLEVYHITHGKNLARIIQDRCLWADAEIIEKGGPAASIGLSEIKARRLNLLEVDCHPGTKVGQYVPFYFCPRSVMLYLLHRGNHPGLTHAGGQAPIIHLVANLREVVAWAESQGRPWAFTDRNAGSSYFESFRDLAQLGQLNWEHISSRDFQDRLVKEAKQAEFLVYQSLPWSLVQLIGVMSEKAAERVREIISGCDHRPDVQVRPDWYY